MKNIIYTENQYSNSKREMGFGKVKLHYQRKTCKDILEICKPIFNAFEISLFSQSRAHHDGRFTSLMTHPELTEHYLERKYSITGSQGAGLFFEKGFYIAKDMGSKLQQQIRHELCKKFNIDHLIFFVDKQRNYDDLYSFATTPENNQFINHFINNIDIIKHFILYFNDKSATLMKKADSVKYSHEYFDSPSAYDSKIISTSSNIFNRDECLKDMAFKKIRVTTNIGEVCISQREFECLKYIAKNYTFKEVAKHLSLSPRTIETYINNLKHKLGCEKRKQLIDIATKLDLPL